MKQILMIFIIFIAVNFNAAATDYYIRTDGNENNSGRVNSPACAWSDIGSALGRVSAGDTIWMADGIYLHNSMVLTNLSNLNNGDNTHRVVVKAINKWGAKIQSYGAYHALTIYGCKGLTIDGLEVFFLPGVKQGACGLVVDNSDWVTIKNCKVHGAPLTGIGGSSDHFIIENNIVYDCCWRNWDVNGNTSGLNFYHNQMYAPGPIPGTNYGIIIRKNIVYNCYAEPYSNGEPPTDGNGIIIDDWNFTQGGGTKYTKGVLIENNLIFHNGGAGLAVYDSDNATIINNTLYYNQWKKDLYIGSRGRGDIDLSCEPGQGNNNKVYNNICITNPAQSSFGFTITEQKNYVLQNNLVNSYRTDPIVSLPTNNKVTDAVFFTNPAIDPATANFHLQPGSEAINAGDNGNAATTDFDNYERPFESIADIGAYEYQGVINTANNYEAENATLVGVSVSTQHLNYSGTGFADCFCGKTNAVQFTINAVAAAVSKDIALRYSSGNQNSSLSLHVNDIKVKQVVFTKTPDWNTWANKAEKINLKVGNNTIKYQVDSGDTGGFNIDYLSVPATSVATSPTASIADYLNSTFVKTSNAESFKITSADKNNGTMRSSKMMIYPNPLSTQELNISIEALNNNKKNKVSIVDVDGKLVFTNTYFTNTIKVQPGKLKPGMYLVSVVCNNSVFVEKLIVE